MKFGLLLPHFGDFCTYDRVFGRVEWMEQVGFNSVWVRDHLSFRPHEYEGQSTRFLEPFTTLTAIAAKTRKLMLGTATIVTFRHPLVTSQLFGTLDYISNGRIIAGVGAGTPRSPYDAVGLPFERRGKVVEEMIDILRLTWRQEHASYQGEIYKFNDMTIDPRPRADTPIYYGAVTNVGIRRTVKFCDGWLPQHTPLKVLDGMVAYLRKLEQEMNKKRVSITYFPWLSIDKDSARARKRADTDRLIERLGQQIKEKGWKDMSATEKELEGSLIWGNPQQCVDQIGRLIDRGYVDEIVFDLRMTFDEWDQALDLLAADVLPHFIK
jgi:alkanesulfonate monooxygenase SsuD/methylene tetrahydromethanopterin reductase-like flavin-dependent oxidoreductase (luciferase family)